MNPRLWIFLGCVWAALGVVLGAFGAHWLKGTLTPEQLANWDTAVRYQLVHALALIAFGLFSERTHGKDYPALLFLFGSLFFSGSIYALCFEFWKGLMGPITPLGGLLLILGWLGFAREALRRR
ncbi:MAG: DUF423 domain-containing protein [Planctomycetes bacterium]|nr:DUF423 domain-containing protein [Planctomycetota bacterium]